MNALDQLWWSLSFWLALRYLQERRPSWMLALGAVLGLGVLTKLSILALCAALPVATSCSGIASVFLRREAWLAMLLAIAWLRLTCSGRRPQRLAVYRFHFGLQQQCAHRDGAGESRAGIPAHDESAVRAGLGAWRRLCAVQSAPALRLLGTTAWLCLLTVCDRGREVLLRRAGVSAVCSRRCALWERSRARPASPARCADDCPAPGVLVFADRGTAVARARCCSSWPISCVTGNRGGTRPSRPIWSAISRTSPRCTVGPTGRPGSRGIGQVCAARNAMARCCGFSLRAVRSPESAGCGGPVAACLRPPYDL